MRVAAVAPTTAPPPLPLRTSSAVTLVAPVPGKTDLSLGAAGLILVCLRLLQVLGNGSKHAGDILWFIGAIGIVASLVGLVMCVVALFKNSGRAVGVVGLLVYAALATLFVALK